MNDQNRDRVFSAGIPIVGNLVSRLVGGIADRIAFRREMREARRRAEFDAGAYRCARCGRVLPVDEDVVGPCTSCQPAARPLSGEARTGCPNSARGRAE